MTEVFRHRDSVLVGHLQSLLESAGIGTYLRNEYASSTTISIPEVAPALCILEEADVERGVQLIREHLESSDAKSEEEHTCPNCGESNPGSFTLCWNCGAALNVKD